MYLLYIWCVSFFFFPTVVLFRECICMIVWVRVSVCSCFSYTNLYELHANNKRQNVLTSRSHCCVVSAVVVEYMYIEYVYNIYITCIYIYIDLSTVYTYTAPYWQILPLLFYISTCTSEHTCMHAYMEFRCQLNEQVLMHECVCIWLCLERVLYFELHFWHYTDTQHLHSMIHKMPTKIKNEFILHIFLFYINVFCSNIIDISSKHKFQGPWIPMLSELKNPNSWMKISFHYQFTGMSWFENYRLIQFFTRKNSFSHENAFVYLLKMGIICAMRSTE